MRARFARWAQAGLMCMAVAAHAAAAAELTAEQIVEKHVAARGGLDAWRKVQSMVWVGRILGANAPVPAMPFVLEFKRPGKMRFELTAQGQTGLRVYDGVHGWKMHSSPGHQPAMQPYAPEELAYARDAGGMDGLLMDYKSRHAAVALEGTDDVQGHKAYRLTVTPPSGVSRHVWIDAQSFLEVQSDRVPADPSRKSAAVPVSYRDYRTVEGVTLPFLIVTGADGSPAQDKMVIDRIVLNQQLDDRRFAMPVLPASRRPQAGEPDPAHGRFRQARPPLPVPPAAVPPAVAPQPGPGGGK